MRALTLHACWAWAVAHAGKDIENRVWKPPSSILGQRIAIHAGANPGASYGQDECAELCQLAGAEPPPSWPRSAILCTAVVAGYITDESPLHLRNNHWYGGPFGWLLADVVTLPLPFPCKGMLGLWEVDARTAAALGLAVDTLRHAR